ncbi:anthocyanidin 3-O-glucosyltransferase 6-like [Euphorbia lathyris]|uniref:anthocyanidin 3-O-glucosyltransferase 6-like n=1 Tax=Euphorbia lathyris TaxID=212925 RepID=UPI00331431FD
MKKKAWLVIVPWPTVGHLASAVEAANLLLEKDDQFSVNVIVLMRSSDSTLASYTDALTVTDRFRFIKIPMAEADSFDLNLTQNYKAEVKDAVSNLISTSDIPLAGFVIDMFSSPIIDVADEFGVPSYIYFTTTAVFLGLMFHLLVLSDEQKVDLSQLKDSTNDAVFDLHVLSKPLPARFLPYLVFSEEMLSSMNDNTRRCRRAKGILLNSFMELESNAIKSLSDGELPPIYPIGPVLHLESGSGSDGGVYQQEIINWLDDQPSSSVIFLCFGSIGCFDEDQVKEIASALEQCGHRFLWSLRRPPPKEKTMDYPTDYENPAEVLPAGFLDRTAQIGKIIGWAPQTAILGHPATGGFVSHCGWNSVLESLWYGVPIATWPIYSEQQVNAFELVDELGLAVEIKMDYRKESEMIVKAEIIERGIRNLMENYEIRKKVKKMSRKSKIALMDGGSSTCSLGRLIEDLMNKLT